MLDLVRGRLAAVAVQDQFDQLEVVGGGHLAQVFQIRRFARENVIFRNGFKGFSCKRQVHRVTRLSGEIDREAGKDGVHRSNAAKSPAAVHAETVIR